MIVVKINQIAGNWIRSTTERLIAANAAGIVGIHSNSIAGPLSDQPSDRQRDTRF
jgi:hypothetical protein